MVVKAPTNQDRRKTLQAAAKIVLLDPKMVWVVHGVPGFCKHQVYAREMQRMDPEPEAS